MIEEHGIGLYYKVEHGKTMAKKLQLVHHIFLAHLITLHKILLKIFLVDTRLGSFLSIFMDLVLHYFIMFFQKSTG